MHQNFIYFSNKEKTLSYRGLSDTRVSTPLTPGSQVYQHPGVSIIETRVSETSFIQRGKI